MCRLWSQYTFASSMGQKLEMDGWRWEEVLEKRLGKDDGGSCRRPHLGIDIPVRVVYFDHCSLLGKL